MSRAYTRDHLKITVAKILQTLGWNSINSTPLEILTDILGSYMSQITRTTNSYANEFGCTQPNLDHLGLAFRDIGINISELEEYVKYVNFGSPPSAVPKYPIPKEDHLNFLKPGSKEVVRRPVHIHEHLPPMNPLLEGNETENEMPVKVEEPEETDADNSQVFKKPADISPEFKRPSFRREEEGSRPTREISSVMMTTSGFLSPAREGKLPEARTPIVQIEPPPPVAPPPTTPPSAAVFSAKKSNKVFKKLEKKKMKLDAPPPPSSSGEEVKKKKINSMKSSLKQKQQGKLQNKGSANGDLVKGGANSSQTKANKALAAARLKTEKLNTTITPITVNASAPTNPDSEKIDKLFSEPDKKKVNIFKKISNVKNEAKPIKKEDIKQESRESSPDLVIDEAEDSIKLPILPNDVTIEPINTMKSPEKIETPYFDDESPGTPSRPKTPEMLSHSPPVAKRKRKEGKKVKKIQRLESPHRLDNEAIDLEMERPKTPEAQGLPPNLNPLTRTLPGFPFAPFGGPGLIPAFPSNPLLPNSLFPPMNLPNFHKKPFMSPFPPTKPIKNEPDSMEDSIGRKNDSDKGFNASTDMDSSDSLSIKTEKKGKEHKKEKKDKIKKRNKKDKIKNKGEKKKQKEEKKEKIKKEKKEKRKDKEVKENDHVKITLKLKSPSPRPETPETRKLNIKPIIKKEDEVSTSDDRVKRETSPGLAKFSALVVGPPKPKLLNTPAQVAFNDSYPSSSSDFVNQMKKTMLPNPKIRTKEIRREPVQVPIPPAPSSKYIFCTADESHEEDTQVTPPPKSGPGPGRPRIHPIKTKPTKPKKRRASVKKDEDGNEVWICPACGRQDDGSPMIGCDGCDAWYHWVCVGIQVPPDENENWYCRLCLSKKNEDLQSDKQKKKRKKKDKKEH